jgi:hypothetical protein
MQLLDREHLVRLKTLCDRYQPESFSEHLAWSSHGGVYFNDLLPLPYTEQPLAHVVQHIDDVQTTLGRTMLLENPSTYIGIAESTIPEIEFLAAIARRTGCGVLLDVNNLYVTAVNMSASPLTMLSDFLSQVSPDDIGEIHLAGHTLVSLTSGGSLLVDDHGSNVCDEVWALFEATVARLGPVPTLVEWDNNLPSFETLHAQAAGVQLALAHGLGQRHARVD